MDDQVTLPAYTDQVREMIRHDRNDEAIAICKHVLKHHPKYIDAYRQMGEAYLEKGDLDSAKDLFRRVLSADPENVVAYTGMSIVFERQQLMDEAIWHLERAYELAPGNSELQKELLRLHGEADAKASARLKLTPGALGRIYAQAGLYTQALQEFRSIIATVPARLDIRVALAETLWRMGHLSEATQVAQSILEQLPYCIKANLILGAAWKQVGLPESEHYLHRAQLLDPTNQTAVRLMGADSPVTTLKAFVPRYVEGAPTPPPTVTAMPEAWAGVEPESQTEFSRTSAPKISTDQFIAAETPLGESGTAAATEAKSSAEPTLKPDVTPSALPSWLQTPFPSPAPTEPEPAPSQEVPSWLAQLRQGVQPPAEETIEPSEETTVPADQALASWLTDQPAPGGVEPPQDIPAWMSTPATTEPEKPAESPLPAWIPKEPTTVPTKSTEENFPSWLAEQAKPAEESLPSWMAGSLATTESATPAEQAVPAWIVGQGAEPSQPAEEKLPAWLPEPSETTPAEPEPTTPSSWLASPTPTEPVKSTKETLPAWIAPALPVTPAEPEKTTPSWLMSPTPTEPVKPTEETLPSWIAPAPPVTPAESEKTTPSWLASPVPIEPVILVEEQLPPWIAPAPPVTPAEPEKTTPSWLASPTPTEPVKPSEEILPPWMAEKPATPVAEPTPSLELPAQAAESAPAEPIQVSEPQTIQPLPTGLADLGQSVEPVAAPAVEETIPSALPQIPMQAVPAPVVAPTPEIPEIAPEPSAPTTELGSSAPPIVVAMPTIEKPVSKVKHQPKGYANLALARDYRAAHRFDDALKEYDYVVQHAPRLVNQVIDDLQVLIQRHVDTPMEAHRILGDAYMRADRLSEALAEYRFVLEHTSK